jgi:hypothetical protein
MILFCWFAKRNWYTLEKKPNAIGEEDLKANLLTFPFVGSFLLFDRYSPPYQDADEGGRPL